MTEAKEGINTLPINQILCGDCIEIMKTFPSDSVDIAMYSPPYYGLRDYKVHGQIGLEPTWQEYIIHMVEVCREVKRVLKQRGSMYVVIGDTYSSMLGKHGNKTAGFSEKTMVTDDKKPAKPMDYKPKCLMGIPWRFAFALIEDDWILRNDGIWHKPNAMPSSVKDRLTQTYEHIFFFVKNRKYYYDLNAIRELYSPSSLKRAGTSGVVPFNLRVRDMKRGKGGLAVSGKLKASEEEIENYTYPESALQKAKQYRRRDSQFQIVPTESPHRPSKDVKGKYESRAIAKTSMHHGSSLNKGRACYYENQVIESNPKGKNPGDVFQTQKEPYIGNNPHRMRLEADKHIALVASRPMDLSHPKGKNPGDFLSICTKPFKGTHFAVYPETICINPIKASCPLNGIVLDPMCGSGTTLAVAKKLGRRYIGIELNPSYVKLAKKRLAEIPEKITTFF